VRATFTTCGIADDARTEEKALDVIPLIEIEREIDDFLRGEARAGDVAGDSVDAVLAVVDAEVGQQNFEQRDAAAVRRIAVTDACTRGRTDAAGARIPLRCSAARARGIVLGRIGEDRKFGGEVHAERLNIAHLDAENNNDTYE
jgi:hypothetical protein